MTGLKNGSMRTLKSNNNNYWGMIMGKLEDLWAEISCKFAENNPDKGYRLMHLYNYRASISGKPSWMEQLDLNIKVKL